MTKRFEGWVQDYDDTRAFYKEDPDQSSPEWDIKVKHQDKAEINPHEISHERIDLEDVENADTIEDALKAYDLHYSWDAINSGDQSPQLGAEMLHRINDKFVDEMSNEQCRGLALERIAMGHAIGRLAERPVGEGVDRTSLKGLSELTYIISIAQIYAPHEVESLEKDLSDVAEKVEGRLKETDSSIVSPLSGPFLKAIERFDSLSPSEKKSTDFGSIVVQNDHESLNKAESLVARLNKTKSLSPNSRSQDTRENTEIAQPTQTNYPTAVATLSRLALKKRPK